MNPMSTAPREITAPGEITLMTGSRTVTGGEGDLRSLLIAGLDGLIDLCHARRGLVVLFEGDGRVVAEAARDQGRRTLADADLDFVPRVLASVRRHGLSFWEKERPDPPGGSGEARRLLVSCVPVHDAHRPCALVYVERHRSAGSFGEKSRVLAECFAQLMAEVAARDRGHWRWRYLDATPYSRALASEARPANGGVALCA